MYILIGFDGISFIGGFSKDFICFSNSESSFSTSFVIVLNFAFCFMFFNSKDNNFSDMEDK